MLCDREPHGLIEQGAMTGNVGKRIKYDGTRGIDRNECLQCASPPSRLQLNRLIPTFSDVTQISLNRSM